LCFEQVICLRWVELNAPKCSFLCSCLEKLKTTVLVDKGLPPYGTVLENSSILYGLYPGNSFTIKNISGPPCSWGIYIREPGPPCWGSLRRDSKVWLRILRKLHTCPLIREGAPQKQDCKFQTATFRQEVISGCKSHKGARYQDIRTGRQS
jgi:hypothetical protein